LGRAVELDFTWTC